MKEQQNWLVVEPTPLKNMSQIGNLPQIGVKIKQYLKPPPRKPYKPSSLFHNLISKRWCKTAGE